MEPMKYLWKSLIHGLLPDDSILAIDTLQKKDSEVFLH